MAGADGLVANLAGAILDGEAIDWPSVESDADDAARPMLHQLKLLASVADTHRRLPIHEQHEHWGHLRVLERIGAGAHGVVYRAWDTRLDREVALKLLPAPASGTANRVTSIIEEGRLLARVRHPNVVTIYGAEQVAGQIGLWMELVPGKTLEELLEGGRTFAVSEAVHIGVELCHAMTAVHSAGLLHRDIKAHNVILSEDGRVVLMDFGTGRELDDQSMGRVAGTPLYLAPEIFAGASASVSSDIYSAGVLLYHLLTGKYPVSGQTLDDLRLAHQRQECTALSRARPDVSRRLCQVVERAIDRRPERRYHSAEALAGELAALVSRGWRAPWTFVAAAASLALIAWVVFGSDQRLPGATRQSGGAASSATSAVATPARTVVPVIAVLPLQNLSSEADSDYFADGLTDEIIRNLAAIDGLEVRSRTSSFFFKGKPRSLRDVGSQLGATLVVEGSVLRDGRRLRVNAQLIRVDGDVPLWSERFDRQIEDVFAIQDEISRAIVNELRLTLGQGRRRYDTNVAVYDLYLKAMDLLERRDLNLISLDAVRLFEQVIAKDPEYAPAYAGLATASAYLSMNPYSGKANNDARLRVRPAAVKALQLDPLLPEAHAAMGWVHARDFEWHSAEKSFQRALELAPTLTSTTINYAYSTLCALGKLDEAERLLRLALRHDPLSFDARRELATVQVQAGRYQEAIASILSLRRADEIGSDIRLVRDLARALILTGRHEEAIALGTQPKSPLAGPGGNHWLARAYVQTAQRQLVEQMAVANSGYPFRLAYIHAALGDRHRALESLEQMFVSEPQRLGTTMMQPELAMLREDPRWIALRRKLKIPSELPVQPRP